METITFHSYRGGVGKTLLSVNTAFKLAELGKKVCLVDFDLQLLWRFIYPKDKQPPASDMSQATPEKRIDAIVEGKAIRGSVLLDKYIFFSYSITRLGYLFRSHSSFPTKKAWYSASFTERPVSMNRYLIFLGFSYR
jgi:cellulose biosynthesis protein BcsQ